MIQEIDLVRYFNLPEKLNTSSVEELHQKFVTLSNSKWKVDYSRNGYIYVINAVGTNRYKIGRTKDLERRLTELNRGQSAHELKLVFQECCADTSMLECAMHSLCSEYRVYGEWFEFDKSFFCSVFTHSEIYPATISYFTEFESQDQLIHEGFLLLYTLCKRLIAKNIFKTILSDIRELTTLWMDKIMMPPAMLKAIDNWGFRLYGLLDFRKELKNENVQIELEELAQNLLECISYTLLDNYYGEKSVIASTYGMDSSNSDFIATIVSSSMRIQQLFDEIESYEPFELFRHTISDLFRKSDAYGYQKTYQ